jgi:hypothetical protein
MGKAPSTTPRTTVVWLCLWLGIFFLCWSSPSMMFRGAHGLTILWDSSKGLTNATTYDPQFGTAFQDLRNFFRETRGYALIFHDNSAISLTNYPLHTVDVFISGSTMVCFGAYSVAEQNRLASFVQKGGGALLQFESPSSGLNNSNSKVNQLLQTITQGTAGLYLPEQLVNSGLLGLSLYSNSLLQGIQITDLFQFGDGSRLNLFNTTSTQVSAAYSYKLSLLGVPVYVAVEMCPSGCLTFASGDTASLALTNQSAGANYKLINNLWNWFENGIQSLENNTNQLVLKGVNFVDAFKTIDFAVAFIDSLPNYNITLTVDGQLKDSVLGGLLNLTEITPTGQAVRTVDFSNLNFTITNGTGSSSNSSIRFFGKAPTGEIVAFVFEVIDQPTVAQFVDDVFDIPANSLKWTLLCTGWNFSSSSNSLVANFFLSSTDQPFLGLSQAVNQNNTGVIYNLTSSETILSVQLLNRALVDDNLVSIQHSILAFDAPSTRVIVQLKFPYFASSIIYDPDYSTLLSDSSSSGGGNSDTLLIVLTSVLIPLAALAVLSVGVGLAVFVYIKKHNMIPSVAQRETINL